MANECTYLRVPTPTIFSIFFFSCQEDKANTKFQTGFGKQIFFGGENRPWSCEKLKRPLGGQWESAPGGCQNGWSDNSYPAKLGGGELGAPLLNRHKYEAPVGHKMQSLCVNCDVVDNQAPSGGNRLAKLVCVNWSVTDSQAPSRGNRLPFRL